MDLSKIDVVILCGGLGTRLRGTIGEKQKTMADFHGRPFMDFLLEYLAGQGFRRAILCAGYQAENIAAHYRAGQFGMEIVVSQEQAPLGTGGAIKNAEGFVHSDPFVALNGDSVCRMDYPEFVMAHLSQQADMTIAVVKVADKREYGAIVLTPDGRIADFQEKSAAQSGPGFISTGIYCFRQEVLNWMPAKAFSIEKDFFPGQLQRRVRGFEFKGKFLDIGTPDRFQEAQQILRKAKSS
jgi:NDP-sugar pyrophosphorylase family protein